MHETRTLAHWAADLKLSDVPEQVREYARRFILDNFGCQIAGATLPWSQAYYDVMRATRSGTHSTVAYFGDKLSPDDAAFVNSTFNHANETDDTHLKSPTHPGGIAVPAQHLTVTTKDALRAVLTPPLAVPGTGHGAALALSAGDLNALIAYIRSL